jgi:hypothetical protein
MKKPDETYERNLPKLLTKQQKREKCERQIVLRLVPRQPSIEQPEKDEGAQNGRRNLK